MVGRFFTSITLAASFVAVGLTATHAQQPVRGSLAVSALSSHLRVSSSGTLHLRGALQSSVSMTMTGAFSVGQARNLQWDLPTVQTSSTSGYGLQVEHMSYTFSVAPNAQQETSINGVPVLHVTWNAPPANTVIRVAEHVRVHVTSQLAAFHSTARYPVRKVAGDAAPYLRVTAATQLPPHAWRVVRRLAHGKRTERAVVEAVINWVASHTHYAMPRSNSAGAVFRHHLATCSGYTNLAIAMLRGLNIPAQAVYGWVAAEPIQLHAYGRTQSIQWSQPGSAGQLHSWMNVYFPRLGWVPFDPQLEKFFVDPRHIAFLTSADAANISVGGWSAYPVSDASVTGRTLSNGDVAILPGMGAGSAVTVHTRDLFRVAFGHEISDVSHVILYSR